MFSKFPTQIIALMTMIDYFVTNHFLLLIGLAWGDVSWRERMVLSSQSVYRNLLLRTPGTNLLSFDVLALSVRRYDDTLDQEKLRNLIRLFRPDRDGMYSEFIFLSLECNCRKN
jgi:hypothetical protein